MFEKRLFEKLEVYKRSIRFVSDFYKITAKLPWEEQYILMQQTRRAAISITLNIAEGAGSNSKKSFSVFIDYSIRSAYETIAALEISKELGYFSEKEIHNLIREAGEICAMLNGLKKSLQR